MHSFLTGAVFVAIVLAPCVIALFSAAGEPEEAPDWNIHDDGFI